MPKLFTLLIATLAATCLTWATATVVSAADYSCTGVVDAQRYENLDVPAGASCTLNGTRVDGNITVGATAVLSATAVTVGGNIQADGAANVTVSNNSTVGGSIQVKQGGSATVDLVRVTGDVQLESNLGALRVTSNTVGGNVQVFQNRGGAAISDNRIDGNLQCKENVPPPTGGDNQAASFEDQCAGFAGALVTPPAPAPGPNGVTICQGSIGAASYTNLTVPAGASCTLIGTRVSGDVTVEAGATLLASGLAVGGNIQAQGAAVVTVNNRATVGGGIFFHQGGSATVDQVQVGGDLQMTANQRALSVTRNQVNGSLRIVDNQAGVVVRNNAVTGALQCQNNVLLPLGGANQAASLEEQCASLNVRVYLPSITASR